MSGRARIPNCLVKRYPEKVDPRKYYMFTMKAVRDNFEMIPLFVITGCVALVVPLISYHMMFVATIDVQLTKYQRWEIPSIPRFFDLRNPRLMKLMKWSEYKPAIHLDNRYRLMRKEPMLDAAGKETNAIGKDETSVSIEELFKKNLPSYNEVRNIM